MSNQERTDTSETLSSVLILIKIVNTIVKHSELNVVDQIRTAIRASVYHRYLLQFIKLSALRRLVKQQDGEFLEVDVLRLRDVERRLDDKERYSCKPKNALSDVHQ